jgi:hypothetical protein
MTEYTHIINGKPATSSKTIDVINPATQKKIAEVPVATKEQVCDTPNPLRPPYLNRLSLAR